LSQPVDGDLNDIGVLVTRPAHQAGPLIELLQQAGARAIPFPVIEIHRADASDALQRAIAQLDSYDLVIFISANAVDHGLEFIRQAGRQLPGEVAAIGQSTAARLQQQGIRVSLQPAEGFNSEALLASDALQAQHISGRQVLIFRGAGGRELLAQTLQQRGAQVDYAEVYQRRRPQVDAAPLLDLWRKGRIQLVTVTSNEALKNLYHMVEQDGRELLLKTPLVVPGQRCAELARQTGIQTILTAANATDQAMLDTIRQWHNR